MKKAQGGFTLIELMIGLVLGLIVTGIAISMYTSTLGITQQTVATVRLNQELRTVVDMMTSDIRRAGYWAGTNAASNPHASVISGGLPLGVFESPSAAGVSDSCVMLTYDYDADGSANVEHIFGYRLVVSGSTLSVAVLEETGAGTPANVDCSYSPVSGGWEQLTDYRNIDVVSLAFTQVDVVSWAENSSKGIEISIKGSDKNDAKLVREILEAVRVRNEFSN